MSADVDLLLDRLPAVLRQLGTCRSVLYAEIQAGRFPPPIRRGRTVAWLHHEVQAFVRSAAAGCTPSQLALLTLGCLSMRRKLTSAVGELESASLETDHSVSFTPHPAA